MKIYSSSRFSTSSLIHLSAVAVVVLAVIFQIRTAIHREVLHYDEGYYLCEARGLRQAIRAATTVAFRSSDLGQVLARIRREGGILPPGNGKPTYILALAALSSLPIPIALSGNFLAIMCGLLAVGLLFCSGRLLGLDQRTAGALALLFLVSPIWNYYVVTTFPHPVGASVMMLGIFFFLKSRFRAAFLTLGLAFTIHYATLPVIGLLAVAYFAAVLFGWEKSERSWKYCGASALCLVAPSLAWEAVYLLIKVAAGDYLSTTVFRTFLQQILYNFTRVTVNTNIPFGEAFQRNAVIFARFARTETWVLSGLLALALVLNLVRWRGFDWRTRAVLAATAGSLAFWLLNSGTVVSRVIVMPMPLLYLGLAIAVSAMVKREGRIYAIHMMVLSGLILMAFTVTLRQGERLRSPYRPALEYLEREGYRGQVIDPVTWPVWQAYLGIRMASRPDKGSLTPEQFLAMIPSSVTRHEKRRIPVAIYAGEWAGSGPVFDALRAALRDRAPDASWMLPYSNHPLFVSESLNWVRVPERPQDADRLGIFWLTPSDVHIQKASWKQQ